MAATAITCSTIDNIFATNDSLFGGWIYNALRETSPWVRLTKFEAFPEGTGYTHQNIRIEGMTTASAETDWTSLTTASRTSLGYNALSAPTLTALTWGQTYTSWNPAYKGYITPCISLDDLKFDHMVTEQITQTVNQLTQVTDEVLSNRARYECARLMPQISCRPGFVNGGNGIQGITDTTTDVNKAGVPVPTSTIQQSILDTLYIYLLRQGGGSPGSRAGMMDGVPQLNFICSKEASDALIRAYTSTAGVGIASDFHFADPGELLKPLGVTRAYRGYVHIIDAEIPRYDLVAGQMVRRLPWSMTASGASTGQRRIYNTAYETAGYELYYVKPNDAYACAVIKDSSAKDIAGASFEDHPYYYSMSFFWSNIKDNTTNILGKLGRWIGISANASHPMYPDHGMTILAKRCYADQTFAACGCQP